MKLILVFIFAFLITVHAQGETVEPEDPEDTEESESESDSSEEVDQLRIGIYYNSLCSDTARFITDHLLPAYAAFRNHIDLYFVPFGKAYSVDHGEYFICQFGPAECYGNMLQLCGLHQICRNEQAQVDFVACEMRLPFNLNATRPYCSELVGVSWDDVTYCINNGLARQLKLEAERTTHRIAYPYPDFVPTIVYNGVFDQELQDRSLREFAYVICEQIDNAHPACATPEKFKRN